RERAAGRTGETDAIRSHPATAAAFSGRRPKPRIFGAISRSLLVRQRAVKEPGDVVTPGLIPPDLRVLHVVALPPDSLSLTQPLLHLLLGLLLIFAHVAREVHPRIDDDPEAVAEILHHVSDILPGGGGGQVGDA